MKLAMMGRLVAGASLAIGMLVVVAPAAGAAQPYPPVTSSGSPTVVLGETISSTLCGFAPGSTVNVSVNGQPVGTVTANGSGCATVTTKVNSTSQATVLGVTVGSGDHLLVYRSAFPE